MLIFVPPVSARAIHGSAFSAAGLQAVATDHVANVAPRRLIDWLVVLRMSIL
eukprot:SAG11_NODE_1008_length_6205_cov_3.939240_6_plen_52_part_00